MTSRERVELLYLAFAQRDGATMAACYHPDAQFSDPVFPQLIGEQIGVMWTMLCEQGKDLSVQLTSLEEKGDQILAQWEAVYSFGRDQRKVHNRIQAQFQLRDGLIVSHEDRFSFWKWSSMALGWTGILLGWTPWLQAKVRHQARANLMRFTPS